jgi:hypothetical protein
MSQFGEVPAIVESKPHHIGSRSACSPKSPVPLQTSQMSFLRGWGWHWASQASWAAFFEVSTNWPWIHDRVFNIEHWERRSVSSWAWKCSPGTR